MENKTENKGPNLKALGFNNPMDIIDLLALIKIDGEPIIKDEQVLLDPKLKAQAVMEYFLKRFNLKPNDLPYFASLLKNDMKQRKLLQRSA